jgi:hypothetical protein
VQIWMPPPVSNQALPAASRALQKKQQTSGAFSAASAALIKQRSWALSLFVVLLEHGRQSAVARNDPALE